MNKPTSVFIDYELESLKTDLANKVEKFNLYKATNTFPTKLGTQALGCWKNDRYSYDESSKMNSIFNDLATDICSSYSNLIIACRKKLS